MFDIEGICNTITETFFDKTKEYNGCVISLRLYAQGEERDSFYHLAYYGRSNYKLVLGALNEMPFFFEEDGFSFLSYHDSGWRYDSYRKLRAIFESGKFRKIALDEITPVNWEPIEFSISSNYDNVYNIDVKKGEGVITIKEV